MRRTGRSGTCPALRRVPNDVCNQSCFSPGCSENPARRANPARGGHVNTAFWRLVLLTLGAHLELVRRRWGRVKRELFFNKAHSGLGQFSGVDTTHHTAAHWPRCGPCQRSTYTPKHVSSARRNVSVETPVHCASSTMVRPSEWSCKHLRILSWCDLTCISAVAQPSSLAGAASSSQTAEPSPTCAKSFARPRRCST